jgi:pimeloyl-ACP methyl ester carboxylesterase
LQLNQFGIIGWSMGGQYALACANYLSDRVTSTCVIAGCLPLDDPRNFSELNPTDRRLTDLAHSHPQNAALAFKAMGEIAQHTPSLWDSISARGLSPKDAETLHQLPEPGLAGMAAPALNSSDGMVEEYRAWVRPWGFTPEQIPGRVNLWHGSADPLVPKAWSEEFARRIPNARLTLIPEQGHFLAYNHYRNILSEFAAK